MRDLAAGSRLHSPLPDDRWPPINRASEQPFNCSGHRYCRNLGWTIVGYDLSLIAHDDDTVQVAILARDQAGHFVAVSALTLAGVLGIGIIDLNTGEARFASLGVCPSERRN